VAGCSLDMNMFSYFILIIFPCVMQLFIFAIYITNNTLYLYIMFLISIIICRRRYRGILVIMILSVACLNKKGAKRLTYMLTKVRKKGKRLEWMGRLDWS